MPKDFSDRPSGRAEDSIIQLMRYLVIEHRYGHTAICDLVGEALKDLPDYDDEFHG